MLTLYNSTPSGNCYKVRLLLSQLGIPFDTIEVDVVGGAPRPAALLKFNPLGKVPVLVFEDGHALAESNAILWRLARGTHYLPADRGDETEVLRWMFFEQNVHEPTIAVNRFLISYSDRARDLSQVIAFNHRRGVAALEAMEVHLTDRLFFVGTRYSIADIALYGYTHVAGEGNFDLAPYPSVRAWLARVCGQPGHVPLGA